MIRQSELALVIDSQKEYLTSRKNELIREALPLVPVVDTFATIVTGLRRCGKSTLLLQLADNHHYKKPIYLNFDDIRLAGFEVSDFDRLHSEIERRETKVLFFDEIQLVKGWEIFIHQLLREGFTVFISGSNASMLSVDLGTHLTGRHIPMELFPFSFTEFLAFTKQMASVKSVQEYMKVGGIPEYVKSRAKIILHTLLEDILVRDIAINKNVREVDSLKQLAVYLLSNAGNLVSANKLVGLFGLHSTSTILEYISYFKDAYLIGQVPQFSYSLKAQSRNPKKVYAMDMGLIDAVSTSFTDDAGHKLENLIYLILRKTSEEVFYFKDKGECDFVTFEKKQPVSAIQVCLRLTSENLDREYQGVIAAMKAFKLSEGTIVTLEEKDRFEKDGLVVNVVPAHEFLICKE